MAVSKTQVVKFIRKGDPGAQGSRGPALRGPQYWTDCGTGYSFQSGAEGEEFIDVVLYNDYYYVCKKSHTKTASNYPGSTTANSNGYWQLGDRLDMIATRILLSEYALVKNLGVECIEMYDADGNTVFVAKDGDVTCNRGTFNDVTVNGGIIAQSLRLKIILNGGKLTDGAFIYNSGDYIAPQLAAGEIARVDFAFTQVNRALNQIKLTAANSYVTLQRVSEHSYGLSSVTLDSNGGFIVGYGVSSTNTIWIVIEGSDSSSSGGSGGTVEVVNNDVTLTFGSKMTIATVGGTDITATMPSNPNTDTKNTAGSTQTSDKLYIVGAKSQANNPQTYSNAAVYIGTDSYIYCNGAKVLTAHQAVENKDVTLAFGGTFVIASIGGTDIAVTMPANPNTDTKNTAGSSNTSSKIYLIGATSQATNPQTYSHDTAYVGTDGCLYSNSTKVATVSNLTDGSVTKVGTGTVGGTSQPVYLNAGVPTACTAYSGLLTALSSASGTNLSLTVGGTTKSITSLYAAYLGGVAYQNILERSHSGFNSVNAVGWYRIAQSIRNGEQGLSCLLFLDRYFNNANNETYVFSINIAYGGKVSITQLSGKANTRLITKIRVTGSTSGTYYIDFYYNSTTRNTHYWTTVGGFKSLTAATTGPAESTNTTEFTTVADGMASNGSLTVAGSVSEGSDRRLKTDIVPLEDRGAVQPVAFVKDGRAGLGFIAQEMQELYPELVEEDGTDERYLSIRYTQYTAVLQAQIIALQKRVAALEAKLLQTTS